MIKIKWDEKSVANVMNNIYIIGMASKEGARRALIEIAQNIMAQSKSECPIETGTLTNSAYIEDPKDTGKAVFIKMGYGGYNNQRNPISGKLASDYALEVHETPWYNHPYGKWKFLEDPVNAHAIQFLSILGQRLRVYFGSGVKVR